MTTGCHAALCDPRTRLADAALGFAPRSRRIAPRLALAGRTSHRRPHPRGSQSPPSFVLSGLRRADSRRPRPSSTLGFRDFHMGRERTGACDLRFGGQPPHRPVRYRGHLLSPLMKAPGWSGSPIWNLESGTWNLEPYYTHAQYPDRGDRFHVPGRNDASSPTDLGAAFAPRTPHSWRARRKAKDIQDRRHLSAFPERAHDRLQSEIEPRPGPQPGRGRGGRRFGRPSEKRV